MLQCLSIVKIIPPLLPHYMPIMNNDNLQSLLFPTHFMYSSDSLDSNTCHRTQYTQSIRKKRVYHIYSLPVLVRPINAA